METAGLHEEIRDKLDRARTELLDLSARNRLLHTPRRSRTARTIEIVDERSQEVFRLLVQESRAFTFAPGRGRIVSSEGAEDASADHEIAVLAQPIDEELDERGVARRHADTKLQTLLTSETLQKRLLNLYFDARTLEEEQGVNILYLALGFLKWYDAESSEIARFAPLILVPVSLERGTAAERFRLRWTQEEPATNLSLLTLMDREHGLPFPSFGADEGGEENLQGYYAKVAAAVADKSRWEVLPDDIVLGFFSFAKFLMYRDLDPANWPQENAIDAHPLVESLLGEGFKPAESPIGEDEHVDARLSPSDMLHVVDADSSQTLAIHTARHGTNLVIQGPPGTGKSQTIANVIAGAVADGKTVLFVAEKMAALEVVKRRLDNIQLGDMCLELHSNKARKREVLEELKRTWQLGRPNGNEDPGLLRRLEDARDALNGHAGRLHKSSHPGRLSAYQCIGHLVRLRQEGQLPSDIALRAPETWSPEDKTRHQQALLQLADYIEDIGIPSQHPWRGAGLAPILRSDLDRLMPRIVSLQEQVSRLQAARDELHGLLESEYADTLADMERMLTLGARVANAPGDLDRGAICGNCWETRSADIADLVEAGAALVAVQEIIGSAFTPAAWSADVHVVRQHLAMYGTSWLRALKGDWRRASALLRSLLTGPPPKSPAEQLRLIDHLIAAQRSTADLARDAELGRSAFGKLWRREKSDWPALRRIVEWNKRQAESGLGSFIRGLVARIEDRRRVASLVQLIRENVAAITAALRQLAVDLRLSLPAAFAVAALEEIPLAELHDRLGLWNERAEDLTKWIAYRERSDLATTAGLGQIVERLADGRLDRRSVIGSFEMAYYDAVLRSMVSKDTALVCFDGGSHDRVVGEFRDLDQRRIELARLEVAAAHYQRMPNREGAAGPLGVLRGEMARRIGHMPIRKLMRRAGVVIQAIKPVFMMSPLSVAQFLEPGRLSFDLLVIDEASQVQPVDALGAVARCGRMIVVGDDCQLPPTAFFSKLTGGSSDEEDIEDGAAQAADIESILGLCTSKGIPSRMLRWHYRSRHQSLIAVSNSQFYDNKLFIVPSPYTGDAGMGLQFNFVRNGIFDRGNTATNPVEAQVVAEAVIHHAKEHPDQSLGVATFSVSQRRVLVDELERLRRLNPDTEEFFSKASAEPFFVKNLENIQGDERDVIFISVGYGKDKSGYMAMQLGPLSAEGGERRLNVLISRAKRRCEVFASITDDDIDLERGRGKGVAALKLFLNFARTGRLGIAQPSGRDHDSIFEAQVAAALRGEGYEIHPQVGLAGFFIDLAVADARYPGRYLLGIECDGATYHSARSARDRDRLRQAVLEDHGWIIHRIWSTDWFLRPKDQLSRTIAAIEAAKAELEARGIAGEHSATRAVAADIVTIDRGDTTELALEPSVQKLSVPYQEAAVAIPAQLHQLHDAPVEAMSRIVHQIVVDEGPVHADEIVVRVRSLWGLRRAGNRIQAAVERGLAAAVRCGSVARDGNFYSLPAGTIQVRDRSAANSPSLRRPDMLPPAELKAAALRVVDTNYGAGREEVVTIVSRVLGFKATSAQLRAVIEHAIDGLLSSNLLKADDGATLSRPAGEPAYSVTGSPISGRPPLPSAGAAARD